MGVAKQTSYQLKWNDGVMIEEYHAGSIEAVITNYHALIVLGECKVSEWVEITISEINARRYSGFTFLHMV